MPTFGQHESEQRLYLSGVGAIYALKSDPKKVIKVLQPPAGIWTDDQLRDEVDGFLLRAKTQKAIAKASKQWAPVHEAKALRAGTEGSSEGGGGGDAISRGGSSGAPQPADDSVPSGAYAILDRYERSVQSLIDGRVNLNNDDLRNVLGGVVRGLVDIRKISNRPHGNLKPANMLLINATDLAQATVHLSDPAADGALTPQSDKKDLADLGKIIYELVNQRPYQGGTIGPSKDWHSLGPNGEDWRKLCNALLDPGAPADDRDLEKIAARIDTWNAKPKKSKLPLLVAAIVVLLIGGGVAAFFLTRPPKIDFDQARWEKLCLSYHMWFNDFLDNMSDENKKKFNTDPYPAEIVKLINEAGNDLNKYTPKSIAKQGQTPKYLAANPTDDARTGYGPYYTKKGDELIDNVSDALTPAKWPLLGTLDVTAATYEKRGWTKPAGGIRSIISAARPPVIPVIPADVNARIEALGKPVNMLANIDATITASKTVVDIDNRWTRIEDQIKRLPQTQVPLLDAFPKFAEDFPRSAPEAGAESQPGKPAAAPTGTLNDVKELAVSFTAIEKVVTQLVTDLNRKDQEIVYAELAKDPAVQLPGDGKITLDMYTHLPDIAQSYVKLKTDPRTTVDWQKSIADVQDGMIKIISDANPQDTKLPTLIQRRDALQQELAALTPISPIQKNKTQLETLVSKASDDLASLTRDGNDAVAPYKIKPDVYIAQQKDFLNTSPLVKATPVVTAQWKKAWSALLTKISASPQELKNYRMFKSVDEKFKSLETIYENFDKEIPVVVPGLADVGGSDWRHTIAAKVAGKYRSDAISELMTDASLKWSEDVPQVNDAAYQSFVQNRLASFDHLRLDTLSLIADFSTIESRLNQLYLQKNEPAPGAATWRDLYTKWTQSGSILLNDADITGALRPISSRVSDLLALDAVNDYKSLLDRGNSSAPEIALASWRKLAAVPVNESIPALDDEDAIEAHIVNLLKSSSQARILEAARVPIITAELTAQRPARWHHWADALSSAVPIQTALDRRASFNVTLNPQSDARMIFNDAYYQLRKQSDAGMKEADLKKVAQSFINSVRAMPPSINQDANIKDLLARMEKPLQQTNEESSSAGAGPKLAGWEQDPSPNTNVRLFYFPNKAAPKHTLEFVRLQVGSKTIYLCTTEMSVGLFADAVADPKRISDLENTGKSGDKAHWFNPSGDPWDGPRVWKINGGKFIPNSDWLFKNPQMGDDANAYYPPSAAPAVPTADMPMQQLSPWSAIYVARMLGCRLPTTDEWKNAYTKFEATGISKDAWNLRGAGWAQQQAYAKLKSTNGLPYPDAGIFLLPDLMFSTPPITADGALPWHGNDLAKVAPNRFSPGSDPYAGSSIWFRKVGAQPGQPAPGTGAMHDLVGNVAEYLFDGPTANAVIKDANPSVDAVDAAVAAAKDGLGVIGGSSLSPPQIPFNERQPIDPTFAQTSTGFSDVGFRLAYTAPIDSIVDVLAVVFKDPKYLAGPNVK